MGVLEDISTDAERPELEEGEACVDLPGKQWATLVDPDTLTNADRKKVAKAFDDFKGGQSSKGLAAVDRLLALVVKEWSFTLPVPSADIKSLDKLPIRAYDELCNAVELHARDVFPDFSASTADDSPS